MDGSYAKPIAQWGTALLPWLAGVIALLVLIAVILVVLIFLINRRRVKERLAMEIEIKEQARLADKDKIDRLNRMKTEFFQDMSHDFKTPLTVISTSVLNAADMLDYDIDKDEMRDCLMIAQREIMRISRMVDSAAKHISLHEIRQDMSPVDVAQLLRDVAGTYRTLLEGNGNTLSLRITQPLPRINSNTDMLLHVLSNLLTNANRYTRNGEIVISAGVADKDADGTGDEETGCDGQPGEKKQYVWFSVRDNGEGVKSELLQHVFERGVTDGGTGLGLALCKADVEAHDGTISIQSEYGSGAEVTVSLPAYSEPRGEYGGAEGKDRRKSGADRRRAGTDRRRAGF